MCIWTPQSIIASNCFQSSIIQSLRYSKVTAWTSMRGTREKNPGPGMLIHTLNVSLLLSEDYKLHWLGACRSTLWHHGELRKTLAFNLQISTLAKVHFCAIQITGASYVRVQFTGRLSRFCLWHLSGLNLLCTFEMEPQDFILDSTERRFRKLVRFTKMVKCLPWENEQLNSYPQHS